MKLLSVIVPCYNEEENIADFYKEFVKNEAFLKDRSMDFEIIFINDGSKDHTVAEIKKLHELDENVNFTKIALDSIKDNYEYIFIDCPPSLGMLTVISSVVKSKA